MKKYLGIDLGGTKIAVGLVNEDFEIVQKASCPTGMPCSREDIEGKIANLCFEVCEKSNIKTTDVEWAGIGAPGSVNTETGVVAFAANLNIENWQLTSSLEKLLNCKVYAENDANAAAYGEYVAGALRDTKYSLAITLGTGVGSGIIINGKLFTGYNASGAELGHMVIVKDGLPCMCGRKGCFEKYASSRALAEMTATAMQENKDNIMWSIAENDIENVNAKTAFDAMRMGDELATQIINTFIEYVACGITNVINIFQPEIICIGGGVSKEGELLLGPIRKHIDKEDYARGLDKRTKIVTAQLMNDAGIIGAALLGRQHT